MSRTDRIYDTRYFWAIYTIKDVDRIAKLKSLVMEKRHSFVSAVTLYEIYKLSIATEGKDVAEIRYNLVKKEMRVVSVSSEIAKEGARISYRAKVPMADAIIMATAKLFGAECVTDDPHFRVAKTRWI